jgi:UDP-N-acetylglucosamine diphosphorylase/glucosamine-1-phosphate N-acetyltransferase
MHRKDPAMHICLFEDNGVLDLEPLTLTRPVFELLCGLDSLAAKQWRSAPPGQRGVLIRPILADLYACNNPDIVTNDPSWLRAAPTLLINGRWLPSLGGTSLPDLIGQSPCVGLVGQEVAFAWVHPEHLTDLSPESVQDCLETWKATLPHRAAGGALFHHLWEIVHRNGDQIIEDWDAGDWFPPEESFTGPGSWPGLAVIGPHNRILIDRTAHLDPLVVADSTKGPVVIGPDAVITSFSRLEGPCCISRGTQIHGAKIRAGSTLGPQCRIGGEVDASIVQGHSNKYHDGFLGHAYVGEWVNLGAGTQNSDLRNDYGEISVTVNGRLVSTGMTKVGCFLGDHTKTGLGALLNTGLNAGVFCNLLPGGLLPRYIPSFASWWNMGLADRANLTDLLTTAGEVMRRRGQRFTEAHAALFQALFEQTSGERRRVLREAEMRTLRRTA